MLPFLCIIYFMDGKYLIENLIEEQLLLNYDEEYRKFMFGYMREQFEFIGVRSNIRKNIQKEYFKQLSCLDRNLCRRLFQNTYRELQYVGMDYVIKNRSSLHEDDITILEYMITTKSWWDTVDVLSSNLVGYICKVYPNVLHNNIEKWVNHENLWLRRSSIIFQLRYKGNTDKDFLLYSIKSNLYDEDFFIQKAIGWALREYSKVDYRFVYDVLEKYEFSKLSKREALRYLNRG